MAHLSEDALLALRTNALDMAIEVALEQFYDGKWKPLSFYSKKLNEAQTKYSSYDRKLLAIYNSLKFFRHVVEARQVIVKTDHKPLVYAFNQKCKASPRQLR